MLFHLCLTIIVTLLSPSSLPASSKSRSSPTLPMRLPFPIPLIPFPPFTRPTLFSLRLSPYSSLGLSCLPFQAEGVSSFSTSPAIPPCEFNFLLKSHSSTLFLSCTRDRLPAADFSFFPLPRIPGFSYISNQISCYSAPHLFLRARNDHIQVLGLRKRVRLPFY